MAMVLKLGRISPSATPCIQSKGGERPLHLTIKMAGCVSMEVAMVYVNTRKLLC